MSTNGKDEIKTQELMQKQSRTKQNFLGKSIMVICHISYGKTERDIDVGLHLEKQNVAEKNNSFQAALYP